jgi:hypothetical protein
MAIRRHRLGRPPLYCSPACQARALRPHTEIDHDPVDGRPAGRIWLVRLHHHGNNVTVAAGLGRPSAEYLAEQIDAVLNPPPPHQGGAID